MLGFAPEASVGGIVRAIRMVVPQFGMVHHEKRPERNFIPSEPSDRRTLTSAKLTIALEEGQDKVNGSSMSVNVVSDINGVALPVASLDEFGRGEYWSEGERGFYTVNLNLSSPLVYDQVRSGALMTKLSWIPIEGDQIQFSYRLVLEFTREDNDAPEIIEQASSVPITFDAKSFSFTGF